MIATGGRGSRMGGNKPERLLGQARLIDWACEWARQHSGAIALAVRRGDGDWGNNLPLLHDAEEAIGPISALHSALREGSRQRRKAVFLLGCDLPFLPGDLVARLCAALRVHGVAMPVSAGRLHPMAALWRSHGAARPNRWSNGSPLAGNPCGALRRLSGWPKWNGAKHPIRL